MKNILKAALLLTAAISLASCSSGSAPNAAPVANFTYTPSSGNAPLLVTTTNTSTDPDAGNTMTYDWDWGDSSAHSTATSPTHTYTTPGTYTITLKTTDNHSASSTKTGSVTVNAVSATPTATVSPANNSLGNAANTVITVTFDQPMNLTVPMANVFIKDPSGAAWPTDTLAYWDNPTTLKISTATGFAIASAPGSGPIPQNEYKYSIHGVSAAGGLINQNYAFKTAVKHTGVSLANVPAKNANINFATLAAYSCPTAFSYCIGDTSADQQVATYLTYDLSSLSSLPADQQPSSFVQANLVLNQTLMTPGAFTNLTDSGENLQLYGVYYGDPTAVGFSWSGYLNLPAANKITGTMGPVGGPYLTDVKARLQADWANRSTQNNLSQYQVRFAKPYLSNLINDQLRISITIPGLSADYLANH